MARTFAKVRRSWCYSPPPIATLPSTPTRTCSGLILIGNTLYAMRREGVPPAPERVAFVREVARHDSPVHNTRRFAASTITLHGKDIREGQALLVLLAAANRDPAVNPDPDVFRPD